jgi:hypothetical protein
MCTQVTFAGRRPHKAFSLARLPPTAVEVFELVGQNFKIKVAIYKKSKFNAPKATVHTELRYKLARTSLNIPRKSRKMNDVYVVVLEHEHAEHPSPPSFDVSSRVWAT